MASCVLMMKSTAGNFSGPEPARGAASQPAGMTFDELLAEARKIKCQESRKQTEHYCEVVVAQMHLKSMVGLLQSYFGEPFKPQGQKPSAEAADYAAPYGGIYDGQTLYCHKEGNGIELALLWPWGSGLSTTVKIIRG